MRPAFIAIRVKQWHMAMAALIGVLLVAYCQDTARAPGQDRARGPLSDLRIVVDPGHGGVDSGCSFNNIFEKELNLAVGLSLQEKLLDQGATVQLTRTTDEALVPFGTPGGSRHARDLAARVRIARDFQARLYLSLHANAGPAHLGGALTFYRKGDEESMRLAALIQEELTKLVPGNQNGILPARFRVLSSMSVPAVLIEVGFLTHPNDRAFLSSANAPTSLANGIAAGVAAYVRGEIPAKPTISPYPAPTGDDPDFSTDLPFSGCSVHSVHSVQ